MALDLRKNDVSLLADMGDMDFLAHLRNSLIFGASHPIITDPDNAWVNVSLNTIAEFEAGDELSFHVVSPTSWLLKVVSNVSIHAMGR